MFTREHSRRNAIAMSIGWWYLRRTLRKRGPAAFAGLVAGEGEKDVQDGGSHCCIDGLTTW